MDVRILGALIGIALVSIGAGLKYELSAGIMTAGIGVLLLMAVIHNTWRDHEN